MEVGALARMDGVERGLDAMKTRFFDDSMPLIEDAEQLRSRADRDGFLFMRGLLPGHLVPALRGVVLDYASQAGWLHAEAPVDEGRAVEDKRIGYCQDPEWVSLQVHAMNSPVMWELGDAVAIHRVLNMVEKRSSYLCLSTANTCRVFSPHPDLVTQPHQDGHYLKTLGDFWTVWIPLGDCPRELGPLALLAGSHHGGLREHLGEGIVDGGVTVPDDEVWSTTDFKLGDAIFFRPHTLHRSLPNCSGDRLRLSVDYRYGFWSDSAEVDWRAPTVAG
jgi:ectoine hydroxylase-related dioxygenase (phytanoyl-CoA dioxygenase family)